MDAITEKLASQRQEIVKEINQSVQAGLAVLTDRIIKLEDNNVTTEKSILKVTAGVSELDKRVQDLEADNTAVQTTVTELLEENDNLKSEILLLKSDMEKTQDDIMKNEQYTRQNNIKIFGIVENRNENCVDIVRDLARNRLHLEIRPEQIAITHRILGKQGKPRPIIVRFGDHEVKYTMLKQRRQLKGSGISIQEDLVRGVWDKLSMIKESKQCKDCWAWNGKIFVKDSKDVVHKYTYGTRIPDPFRY